MSGSILRRLQNLERKAATNNPPGVELLLVGWRGAAFDKAVPRPLTAEEKTRGGVAFQWVD